MMSNAQFWNSITMTAQEFKDKYSCDVEFWKKDGEFMYNRMVLNNNKKQKSYLKEKTKAEQWKNNL
jgi:hypothetical protein